MVALGFTVLKKKILSGEKRQTIRLDSTKWQNVVDKIRLSHKSFKPIEIRLQLYWHLRQKDCKLLKEVKLFEMNARFLDDITEEEAKRDGFKDLNELKEWFKKTYPKVDFTKKYLWIIRW